MVCQKQLRSTGLGLKSDHLVIIALWDGYDVWEALVEIVHSVAGVIALGGLALPDEIGFINNISTSNIDDWFSGVDENVEVVLVGRQGFSVVVDNICVNVISKGEIWGQC